MRVLPIRGQFIAAWLARKIHPDQIKRFGKFANREINSGRSEVRNFFAGKKQDFIPRERSFCLLQNIQYSIPLFCLKNLSRPFLLFNILREQHLFLRHRTAVAL